MWGMYTESAMKTAALKKQAPKQNVPPPNGKRRLIEAALKLGARGTPLDSLGLRELAREAGLNHNTFYRHFDDLDELSIAAAEEVASQIMAGMKEVRRNAATHADATVGAAEYFLDFVRDNPDPFIVGLREVHSTSSPMRWVLQKVIDQIAVESVEQITSMNLAPGIEPAWLMRATSAITYYMFYRSLDYIEHPRQRQSIIDEIVLFARMQFYGAAALQSASS